MEGGNALHAYRFFYCTFTLNACMLLHAGFMFDLMLKKKEELPFMD